MSQGLLVRSGAHPWGQAGHWTLGPSRFCLSSTEIAKGHHVQVFPWALESKRVRILACFWGKCFTKFSVPVFWFFLDVMASDSYVADPGLELSIFLPFLPSCWDYSATPVPATPVLDVQHCLGSLASIKTYTYFPQSPANTSPHLLVLIWSLPCPLDLWMRIQFF